MAKTKKNTSRKLRTNFGPVSTVSTAPVAIGNSIRGSVPKVVNLSDGVRVIGRDFAFAPGATASSITNWQLIGGMPVSPCVLPSSILRSYVQTYAYFKFNRLAFHYITSSPTSQAGDVLFYYERDRKAPCCDWTNSSFLPYVLSDDLTIIGPQWTNHTAMIKPVSTWKTTNFAMNADLDEDSLGTIMMFSKTNATNSPGYILVDYDVSFKSLSVNPRAGSLLIARGQMNPISFGLSATAVTAGSNTDTGLSVRGVGLDNAATAMPNGAASGDVYKVTISATASTTLNTFTACTLSNLVVGPNAVDVAIVIDDGFTAYITYGDSTSGGGDVPTISLYPTLENAITGTKPFVFGVTGTITFALIAHIQLVYSNSGSLLQSSY